MRIPSSLFWISPIASRELRAVCISIRLGIALLTQSYTPMISEIVYWSASTPEHGKEDDGCFILIHFISMIIR